MKCFFIATLLFLFCNTVAFAEVVHIDKHGFIVKNTVEVQSTPKHVWRNLTKDIDRWWPKDHSWWKGKLRIDARAGGCFCESSGKKSAEHMRITYVEPEKVLRMTGGLGPLQGMGMHGALDWTLEKAGERTRITLSYRVSGINEGGFNTLAPIVARVQNTQLKSLAGYVEQRARK